MKISVWQQFSSNHSSRFEVVGVFRSAKEAELAGRELLEMLREINVWFEANRSDGADWDSSPSPVEKAIAERFGIQWNPYTFGSWLWFDPEGRGPVHVVNNLVFVNGSESDTGAKPLDDIIRRLGGDAFVNGTLEMVDISKDPDYPIFVEVVPKITFTLTCAFADETSATEMVRSITLSHEDAQPDEPYKLHINVAELRIEAIEHAKTSVMLKNIRMHPLGRFKDLLNFLTERGVVRFQCELSETRSRHTRIDQGDED